MNSTIFTKGYLSSKLNFYIQLVFSPSLCHECVNQLCRCASETCYKNNNKNLSFFKTNVSPIYLFTVFDNFSVISQRVESISYNERSGRLFFTVIDSHESGSLQVINDVYGNPQVSYLARGMNLTRGVEFDTCEK